MLTIKETSDKTKAQDFLKNCDSAYKLGDDIVMVCEENDKILGITSLSLKEGLVYLDLLVLSSAANDMSLKLGLLKAIMNLADLRGIKKLYGNNKNLEELYKLLRFKEEDGKYVLNLEGYFTTEHCD